MHFTNANYNHIPKNDNNLNRKTNVCTDTNIAPLSNLFDSLHSALFYVIAGPCVIQNEEDTLHIACKICEICNNLKLPVVFKASFDKANRTSGYAYRGVGIEKGLEILQKVKDTCKIPILTDIHLPEQAIKAAKVCDILQIPAFLCRQTDLIEAAATACGIINVKKGQFLSPYDTKHIVEKSRRVAPQTKVILTERGASFGYNNLVVDMRSFVIMSEWADSVVYDATHSVQLPGGLGEKTGGQRYFIKYLAQAAIATGKTNGIFMEVHYDPSKSPSDSENILPLSELENLLKTLISIKQAISS